MFRIILPILMIVTSVAGFVLYTKPMYQEAVSNSQRLNKVSDALKRAKQLSDIKGKLEQKYNQIPKADLDRIKKMIPDSVENIGLIIELNNIANSRGIELQNPSISTSQGAPVPQGVSASSENKKYGSIALTFSVTTTYDKFIGFLEELENTLRLVDITNITFNAPDARTGESVYTLSIQTYWLVTK